MKLKFLYFLLLLVISGSTIYCQPNYCELKNATTGIISVSIKIIGTGNRPSLWADGHNDRLADFNNYFTLLSVTNKTDSTIHFITMSCSWEENWCSSNDSIYLFYPGCDRNYLIEIKLDPHKSIDFNGLIRVENKKIQNRNFSLGFAIMPLNRLACYKLWRASDADFLLEMSKTKFYWSNEIILEDNLYDFKIENTR